MSEKVTELTNEMLKSLMTDAMVFRGHIADLNQEVKAGVYRVDMGTKNLPKGAYQFGLFLVGTTPSECWMDMYIPNSTVEAAMYVRTKYQRTLIRWMKFAGVFVDAS